MRLPPILLGLLTVSTFAQAPAAPQPAPAAPETAAAPAQPGPSRKAVVGKWFADEGDQWEFTAGGSLLLTLEPSKPVEVKVQRGTYVMIDQVTLKIAFEGRNPEIVEYFRNGDTLSLKSAEGLRKLINLSNSRMMAVRALEELRLIDAATDQWAIEHNKQAGDVPTFANLQEYLKKGTRLHFALGDPTGPKDILGHPFGPVVVDTPPKVHPATVKALSKDVPREFWKPFLD